MSGVVNSAVSTVEGVTGSLKRQDASGPLSSVGNVVNGVVNATTGVVEGLTNTVTGVADGVVGGIL